MTAADGRTRLQDLVESYNDPTTGDTKDGMDIDEVTDTIIIRILDTSRAEAIEMLRPLVDPLVRFGFVGVGS